MTSQNGLMRYVPWLAGLVLVLGGLALLMLAMAGPGARMGWWHFGTGFDLMRWGAWTGIVALVLGIAAIVLLYRFRARRALLMTVVGLACAAVAVVVPVQWRAQADEVPPIHDTSTDLADPPEFVEIAPLREDAPNPVAYAGEETAEAQRAAYPHLEPIRVTAAPDRVMEAALQVANRMGWEVVHADTVAGKLEATATTFWFGFKDDVVIRIREDGGETVVDVRSKSRIGQSDLGANAKRIEDFRDRLLDALGED